MADDTDRIVEAIHDLTRVTIALHGGFDNKSEIMRKLSEQGMTTARISAILGIASKDVSSALAKAKKGQKANHEDE